MKAKLQSQISGITPPSLELRPQIQQKLDFLTKPPGSLGQLEEMILWLGSCQNQVKPTARNKRIYVCAGDHGVTAEGVSPFPSSVTGQMVANMLAGGAAISVLSRQVQADLWLVDAGVDGDLEPHPRLIQAKIKKGSANLAQGPALSETEGIEALFLGMELAAQAKADGVELLGTGEMGIGNTTPATAIFCSLFDLDPMEITGAGTGLDPEGIAHKARVIQQALDLHLGEIKEPWDHLFRLGGLEIAALAGLCLGAAREQIPLIVDGFIATAAAAAAIAIEPQVKDWLLFSHQSAEQGHQKALASMGVTAILDLQLRLGEGTGAALVMGLLDSALALYNEMATFEGAGVDNRED